MHDRYGSPDVLRIEDVPVPSPGAGQVRVQVAATAVNLSDWEGLRGRPGYARLGGLRSPRRRTLGSDIAGVVDAVGEGVTRFRTGDEVYGDNLALMGGFAEYALAPESALAPKPAGLTFAEASTIPQAGAIALRGTERVGPGSRVLINGAGGGSGALAIQLARRRGAHVTGVDNAAKLDFMRAVGAHEVVDYRREDFTRTATPYDLVLDLVAHRSVFAYRRSLARGGTYRCVGGSVRALDTPTRLRELAALPVRVSFRLADPRDGVEALVAQARGFADGGEVALREDMLSVEVPPARLLPLLQLHMDLGKLVQGVRVEEPGLDAVYDHLLEEAT